MLSIYIGKENMPNNMKFVYDPESVTSTIDLLYNDVCADIVSHIDKGKVINSTVFKDRFGIGIIEVMHSIN